MSIPHPVRDAEAWARVLIGGSRLPGILTEAQPSSRKWKWTVQSGYAQSEVTIFKGTGLLETITFTHFLRLTDTPTPAQLQQQIDDWEALTTGFLPTLIPGYPVQYKGKPKALPVDHPALQFLACGRIHLVELHPLEYPAGEKIPQFYKLTFQEDVPRQTFSTGPAEPAKLNGPPTPQDANEAALLAAMKKFLSL